VDALSKGMSLLGN